MREEKRRRTAAANPPGERAPAAEFERRRGERTGELKREGGMWERGDWVSLSGPELRAETAAERKKEVVERKEGG